MTMKLSRIVGAALLAAAVIFVIFALNHPEMSFPWSNGITYTLYGAYAVITFLLLAAPWRKRR